VVDQVAQNQIKVLFRQLDTESRASLLIDLADCFDDTFCGVPIDEEVGALCNAADELHALIKRCPDLARERYDPAAARADRAYEAIKDKEDDYDA